MEEHDYGFIAEGKVYRKPFLTFEEKEIGEVKESNEDALNYFSERFALAQSQVAEVEQKINETENKGSYLMKVLHLKDTLHQFDALGDFASLYQKLDLLEEQLNGFIRQNRAKNYEIKTALLAEMQEATKSNEWKSATEAVKEVQRKWIRTGAVDDEVKEQIEGDFKKMLDDFFARKAEFYADLEKMMVEKEADYEEFLKNASDQFNAIAQYTVLVEKIRELKEAWKGLGRIKKESRDKYWAQFQGIITNVLAKAKKEKKAKVGKDKSENIGARQEFLKELESLNEGLVPKASVKELKNKWKALGPVPKKEMDKMHPDFLFLIDQISEKQFIDNLAAKKLKGKANDTEKEKMRTRVLYDLLNRDRAELSTFKENLEKFNTSSGLDRLIDGKLDLQERKVRVKEAILEQIKKRP